MKTPSPNGGVLRVCSKSVLLSGHKKKGMLMSYFVLIYYVVEAYVERRMPFREEHLRLAREAQSRGDLILGGAFADPADRAMLIFRCSDKSVVEEFVTRDPYVANGLVMRWEIRPWTVVIY
jgi:uncharacterized protein YciI